jgi:outer membrane protein OmpA-like peptidoglycan-associated protein
MTCGALLLLLLCALPLPAQQAQESPAGYEPSKYRILHAHLLPGPRGPQAGVSRCRFAVNFGSREGVKPGSVFRVMDQGVLMGLVRVEQVWRDSAWVRLINLVHKKDPEALQPLEVGYYLEPRFVLLETIHFDQGKPVITPEMYERLHYAARFVRAFPGFPLVLEGHTDAVGKAEENQKLSEERAQGVRTFLNEVFRLPAAQLHAVGYGQTRPLATNATAQGRYRNRRVDIVLTDEKPQPASEATPAGKGP